MKIAVLRGLFLGDLVAATPALRALRRGHPRAEITLATLPHSAALAPHLPPSVDRVLAYPGAPGLDGWAGDEAGLEAFLIEMRAERFDLAVNLHGRGPQSTRLVRAFGARRLAAFTPGPEDGLPAPDAHVPWQDGRHESENLLRLAGVAGGSRDGTLPSLQVRGKDRRAAGALVAGDRRPLALVHPGASAAEKRWPAERFGEVARGLLGRGFAVVVTGGASEGGITGRVAGLAPGALDLGGRTDLSALIGLVDRASVAVTNDTGPAHLAYALATPSVTVFGPTTDAKRWGPPAGTGERHAVLVGDPIGGVGTAEVLDAALAAAGRQTAGTVGSWA